MSTRRDFLVMASVCGSQLAAYIGAAVAQADPANERPKEGDVFVAVDAATPVPLELKDIVADAAPVRAWPMDPANHLVRSGTRLNKVLLLRLDPATLSGDTKDRAADGVVAYSAFCPHAGCDVTGWIADQKLIECACHASQFNPRDGASVTGGPAPRPLPALPLKLVDGKLTVAKPFTSRVGIVAG